MANVSSNSIRIFPASNRNINTAHYGTNFITEYNLSSVVNKLLLPVGNQTGFLISTSTGENLDGVAEFNIGGYYVTVDSWNTVVNAARGTGSTSGSSFENFITFTYEGSAESGTVYANAILRASVDNDTSYRFLAGQDGVSYNAVATTGSGDTSLKLPLLTYSSGSYSLSKDSRLKFVNFVLDDGIIS